MGRGTLIASLHKSSGESVSFASSKAEASGFNVDWGKTEENILVRSPNYEATAVGFDLDQNTLLPETTVNIFQMGIQGQLNGAISGFGVRFWQLFKESRTNAFDQIEHQEIESIEYTDRYLANPLMLILLHKLISGIPYHLSDNVNIRINTLRLDRDSGWFQERRIQNNWYQAEDGDRQAFMKLLFGSIGVTHLDISNRKRELSHARILTLNFTNDLKLTIRFDQGMGYWSSKGIAVYPFDEDIEDQIAWIDEEGDEKHIRNSMDIDTYVFVEIK